ncbi:MAG: putative DNA binding domain-containing protein [Alphaproteobacteria bacterium]|nr:putative DNA binding domain-containing protein [Alphaproteobacteria bacterium]
MNLGKETEFVEFKASTSQTSRALEALATMLNKHGKGKVYFGVEDNGNIVGQDIGNKTIKDLSAAITSRIKPYVLPTIKIEILDDKNVISVEVEGDNNPYCADGNYLIRSGCENKKLEPEHLKDLLFTNSIEMITKMESFNQELSFNQIKQLYTLKELSIDTNTFEKNMGFFCKNQKYNELANLLSDNNDYSIKVVRFAGTDKSEMIMRNEYGYKCLIYAMRDALEYVNLLNETKVIVNGNLSRQEIKLFDEKCLREAWINACLHSKWSKMVPPAIYIFKDRIEIISTGGLPVDYSTEDFYIGISHPINRQLQKIMGQLGIVEQTGHGVPEIVNKYGKEAFDITENHIIVTLRFPFEISSNSNQTNYDNLSKSQINTLKALISEPSCSANELSKIVGLGTTQINKILKELKQLNKIERVGSNKTGYWKVIK